MISLELVFEVHGYWHVGTGRGGGASADAVVSRDDAGLPCIPGRQVKGLLREAVETAEAAGVLTHDPLYSFTWFGSHIDGAARGRTPSPESRVSDLESFRFRTEPGSLVVSTASVGANRADVNAWRQWARTDEARPKVREMFRAFASTKVDDAGVADEKTLRSIEVVVPMTLCAEVTGPDGDWGALLARALPLLDGVGGHRNRGLGRVTVTLGGAR